jgi:hypothetical protein
VAEITVLDVQPAQDINADLVCKLRTISLHTPLWRYDALSYAWGNTATVENIIVNGIFKRVTRNLVSALRHLRDTASVVTLWVDAISINQSDVAEREQQVRLMRKIHRYAIATRAWLGPVSAANDFAFDFFLYLGTTQMHRSSICLRLFPALRITPLTSRRSFRELGGREFGDCRESHSHQKATYTAAIGK